MPYIKLMLNGQKLVVGGAERIDILSFSLIASKDSSCLSLNLSGMRRVDGRTEHLCWCQRQINFNDNLRIIALKDVVSSTPDISMISSVSSAKELLGRHRGWAESKFEPIAETPSGVLQFLVEFPSHEQQCVTDSEETLQLVTTWLGGSEYCKLLIDSITVMEDGTTQGKRWLEQILRADEWVEVSPRRLDQ